MILSLSCLAREHVAYRNTRLQGQPYHCHGSMLNRVQNWICALKRPYIILTARSRVEFLGSWVLPYYTSPLSTHSTCNLFVLSVSIGYTREEANDRVRWY